MHSFTHKKNISNQNHQYHQHGRQYQHREQLPKPASKSIQTAPVTPV